MGDSNMNENNYIDKIKNVVIIILILIIIFGGSYVASELSYYKKNFNDINNEIEISDIFNNININKYKELLIGDSISLIYIGRDDCEFSKAENVVLEEIISEYGIIVNYIDLNQLDDDEFEFLYSSYENFIENGIATPTMMLVKNNEVVMFKKGYTSKEDLIQLFRDNNFIME